MLKSTKHCSIRGPWWPCATLLSNICAVHLICDNHLVIRGLITLFALNFWLLSVFPFSWTTQSSVNTSDKKSNRKEHLRLIKTFSSLSLSQSCPKEKHIFPLASTCICPCIKVPEGNPHMLLPIEQFIILPVYTPILISKTNCHKCWLTRLSGTVIKFSAKWSGTRKFSLKRPLWKFWSPDS